MPATAQTFRVIDHSAGLKEPTPENIAIAVAKARGCATDGLVDAFLSETPMGANPVTVLRDFSLAAERLFTAIQEGQAISIFGDYDVDGATSLVLMYDLLRTAGHKHTRLYIPNRATEGYGLSMIAAKTCQELQDPKLIFTVDCGSTSIESLEFLKGQGIDVIVLDHHSVTAGEGRHPAYAHLNPKGDVGDSPELTELRSLSAAGLAFLFCEEFARAHGYANWNKGRAEIIGGLGTLADVMPLTGLNRILVKRSLSLANASGMAEVPGLAGLAAACSLKRFDSMSYGFILGPHLNAAGRLGTAQAAVKVLAAGSVEGVAGSIKELVATNTKRKDIQKAIIAQATDMAEDLLAAHPDCKVLLLASEGWEPGVVGIVAARIKEKFFRPTFVCGMNDGFWKGSGRSVEGYDLGALVHRAMDAKVIMGGGGHAMAAGISFTKEQLLPFMNWIEEATTDIQLDFTKTYEVLGNAELFSVNDWLKLYQRLEPYGQANRRCALLLDNVTLVGGPDEMTKNSDGSVWALKAKFATDAGATFSVTWGDLDRAASLWSAGSKYRMVVSLSKSEGKGGRTYENWRVDDCEQVD